MAATPAPGRSNEAFEAALRAEPFRSLDARGRADVRASCVVRRYEPGAAVFLAAEPADTLFVLARGAVRLENGADSAHGIASVRAGELFGHDALVPFAMRGARAVAVEASTVLELPAGVFRRVLVRSGVPELLAREEARARRKAWTALLGRTALGALPPAELVALAAALVEEPRERGEALEASRERSGAAWLVAGGLFEVRAGDEGDRPGYAARGDVIGLSPARSGALSAMALGSALALRIPRPALDRVARSRPELFSALERAASARETKQRRMLEAAERPATRHASDEMARLASARSLLAIDLDRCTRCGHCTRACADAHGSARLERRGEKVVVTLRAADSIATAALLFPSACQHCRDPACLEPCPTGAIRREATGAVELDPSLCTGCGACAKACPWDAIRMAPRAKGAAAPSAAMGTSAEVAVKCDLCRGHDGPECVAACPTDAIFRLDPRRDVVEVRAAVGPSAGARAAGRLAHPRAVRGVLALSLVPPVVALERSLPAGAGQGLRLAFGALGLVLVVALAAHAVVKRVGPVRRRARRALSRSGAVSTMAPLVALHAAGGIGAAVSVFLHGGFDVRSGLLGALALSFWGVAASGLLGALVYRFVPTRLSRIERTSGLSEDEPNEREALLDRLHAAVSGANLVKKELARRVLVPYAIGWGGALSLLASGRTLGAEEAALAGRIERLLGGRKSARLGDIEELVRTAVEMRALRARRLARALLRGWLPVHLLGSALVLVLLAFHVAGALR